MFFHPGRTFCDLVPLESYIITPLRLLLKFTQYPTFIGFADHLNSLPWCFSCVFFICPPKRIALVRRCRKSQNPVLTSSYLVNLVSIGDHTAAAYPSEESVTSVILQSLKNYLSSAVHHQSCFTEAPRAELQLLSWTATSLSLPTMVGQRYKKMTFCTTEHISTL